MSSDSGFTPGSAPSDGQPPPPQPNPTLGAPLLRTLYWASGSPPAWRALLTLAEKRIPFNSVMVTFESGILRTPAHLALNPRGLVPVLIDGPVRMYESLAIIQVRRSAPGVRDSRACIVVKRSTPAPPIPPHPPHSTWSGGTQRCRCCQVTRWRGHERCVA